MKRLVLCFDGTWNTISKSDEVTNVVRIAQALKPVAADGTPQIVYYNAGVGSGGRFDRLFGGAFGAGLKDNVKRGLTFLSFNYDEGNTADDPPDEIYIFGFSRGAYTARALAGVIGAIGGIPKVSRFGEAETLWAHYRKDKENRSRDQHQIREMVYDMPKSGKLIKCVAVWDTVGSYGIPTGFSFGGVGRMATAWTRNFRDNEIGRRIAYGFHAMAIDERRRQFKPTAWVKRTAPVDDGLADPEVEQVWFAGAHSNVGGGYREAGLSDTALIWMIARVEEKTGLEFDADYISRYFWPCSACSAYRSEGGWLLSKLWPSVRQVTGGDSAIVDGRVHWSVKDRLGRVGLVDETRYRRYAPSNVQSPRFTEKTPLEEALIARCRDDATNDARGNCALHCDLATVKQGGWRARFRARRMEKLRESWQEILGGDAGPVVGKTGDG